MGSRVRSKQPDGLPQKIGPLKATLPMSSILREPLQHNCANKFGALSPPIRHASPEYICGHRSPGAYNCKVKRSNSDVYMRRTASLDALYMRPQWNIPSTTFTILHLDKATQTDISYTNERCKVVPSSTIVTTNDNLISSDIKFDKPHRSIILQKTQRGEHSVSSQTLSPIHTKASPVLIPTRSTYPTQPRLMRNSVEGINQEIEKLGLNPGNQHSCRPETSLFFRGTPENQRPLAPLADLLHCGDTRTVNTQTPNRDQLSSDDSESTSPDDGTPSMIGASPRINRFLAREPPDGCEKVQLKLNETTGQKAPTTAIFKPNARFFLRPSLGSAFKPLQPISTMSELTDENTTTIDDDDTVSSTTVEDTNKLNF